VKICLIHGAISGVIIIAAACTDARPAATPPPHVPYDHHVHILGPQLVRDWQSLDVPFSRPDSAYTSASAALGGEATAAFLVSMAHVYGTAEFRAGLGLDTAAERQRVRTANEHVAREAARDPALYVGFCSVPLLRPYAAAELEHCAHDLGLAGIKIHVPAMGISLVDATHLTLLAGVVERAARERRPVLVHLAPVDGELSDAELRNFLAHVVEPHAGLELYLAHLGGNGGYRASARRVVHALTELLHRDDAAAARRIYVELSGALLARRTDGVPASRRADAASLASDLRALGLARVLFGSDYPVFERAEYAALLRDRLPLSTAELDTIMQNRAPRFERAARLVPHSRYN
jgi:uncharacterized protein